MSIVYPPPHLCIIIVDFIECSNGRTCESHPDGCGIVVLERDDHGLGILLHWCMVRKDELAAYAMKSDGSNGCHIAFVEREYAASDNGSRLNGTAVHLVDIFLPDDENTTANHLYHQTKVMLWQRLSNFMIKQTNNKAKKLKIINIEMYSPLTFLLESIHSATHWKPFFFQALRPISSLIFLYAPTIHQPATSTLALLLLLQSFHCLQSSSLPIVLPSHF
jgi:hypothetical protein